MPRTSHSYFVVMQNYRSGLEANVQPEITRREVVSRLVTGEYKDVEFIHFVETGNFVVDMTEELLAEAEAERGFVAEVMSDPLPAQFDHRRDELKHGERV